jgi:predicted alpha-1,2-mannosidase
LIICLAALALVPVVGIGIGIGAPAASALSGRGLPAAVSDPAGLVNPIAGTGTGPVSPGAIGEFPGADVPFGMVQFSPDTTPDVAGSGGLYSYADSHISGFSLTHLSGTGCAAYGDLPILPTVGSIGPDPEQAVDTFSHSHERAAPGRYQVTLGPAPITTALSVTTRTGISRFTFPSTHQANLLFKVAGSANPVTASHFVISGHDAISGQVTSGQFCGTGTNYTLYFSARFSRPFSSFGSWNGTTVSPGSSSCRGPACGAFLTFDAGDDRSVMMKVGISFVNVRNAAQNLKDEDPGWSLSSVRAAATSRWNLILRRIGIGGGTRTEQGTFYTALYHSLLHPNVVSDDNGQYIGDDGKVHRSTTHAQYANFSEWDIYRSEIPLLSMVAPRQVSDMMQSLVNDAQQNGWLPKWAIVDGDASQMNGDSADPILADAYAFGIRGFNATTALKAMVKGATENETGHGLEIERQYLDQYLSQHYVNAGSLDLTSINYSIGGSVTLEYAIDDFAIAQMAKSLGDHSLYRQMMQRAQSWEYEFNPSTGYVQARNADGSFPAGPAFSFSDLDPGGQVGFEEGNAIQYTWAVPQDLAALGNLMGGDAQAVQKLDSFFTHLNVTRYYPYDWAGNEPSLGTPWEYDSFGAPAKTQETVRRIVTTLYSDTPVDEPGNDDLGAISSWYVWAAIGLYPVTPGTANLALGSPLFPYVNVELPDGRHLVIKAPGAEASKPYVASLVTKGIAAVPSAPSCQKTSIKSKSTSGVWLASWLPASVIRSGGTLTFGLSSRPTSWGSNPADSPPSYEAGALPAVGFSFPGGGTSVTVGQPASVQLGIRSATNTPAAVSWSVAPAPGLTVSPTAGTLTVAGSCIGGLSATALQVTAASGGAHVLKVLMHTASGQSLPPVDLDVTAAS